MTPRWVKSLETLATLHATQGELNTHQIQLAGYTVATEAADAAHRATEQKLQQSDVDLARLRSSEAEARTTRDAIAWVIGARPEFDRLSAEAIELKTKLDEASALHVRQRASHADAAAALTTVREMLAKAETAHRGARESGARVRAAQDGLAQGLALETLIGEARAEEDILSRALTELQSRHAYISRRSQARSREYGASTRSLTFSLQSADRNVGSETLIAIATELRALIIRAPPAQGVAVSRLWTARSKEGTGAAEHEGSGRSPASFA